MLLLYTIVHFCVAVAIYNLAGMTAAAHLGSFAYFLFAMGFYLFFAVRRDNGGVR